MSNFKVASVSGWRQKLGQVISGSNFTGDTMHELAIDYGYPEGLEFEHFWNMYRRFGIAKNVCCLPVDTAWITPPIINGSPKFNAELERLDKRINLYVRMKGLDTRQRVGRYAGMFMRVRDGKLTSEPIDGVLPGETAIMEMMPLYESQLEVIDSDNDPTSENYGQPIMLQYSQSITGSRNEEAVGTINIHASRIVFAAEGSDNNWIYGIPALEPVYNSLMDLVKIIGGGAEGFYKNAAQSIVFDLKDGASAITYKEKLDQFNEQYDEFSKNRSRRALWTPGMDANTLESSLISPKEFFQVAINNVAAGAQIPAAVLVGQQTGRLASDQDGKAFLAQIQSRRVNFVTEMVSNITDWMIKFGILPASEYEIEWDDLLARSEQEKLQNAQQMSEINQKQFQSGGDSVFSAEEIRESAGFDPEEIEDIGSEALEPIDGEE